MGKRRRRWQDLLRGIQAVLSGGAMVYAAYIAGKRDELEESIEALEGDLMCLRKDLNDVPPED